VENLKRSSYKALILLLKIIPMLIAFFDCLSTTLYFFDIQCDWISYIAGISLLPLAFIYLASLLVIVIGIVVGMFGSGRAVRKYLKV
jgi:cell division protein FtsX